ncbi:MAG TPA: NADH-quinone oxidoreductase subunit D [Acidobacteriaceae bacterium]|nr:NADH-quinone oxidoreductase subunit D [Acidobacteriaceae bacterium]
MSPGTESPEMTSLEADAFVEAAEQVETPEAARASAPPVNADGEQLLEISMGPHHPSTHGVFRMNVVLEGERVRRLKPVFGYLHRNHEQIAEKASYLAAIPYTDRLDYLCSMTNNWAYALSVEKLAGLTVPERAEYIRVIVGELTRLQNHASLIGFLMQDMGASGTPLMYAFREREKILDLFESLSGARMMCNYMRFGGVRVDTPPQWLEQVRTLIGEFPRFLDEFEALLMENEILLSRTQGVGVLPSELAVSAGTSGPMLRASGVNYDVRKVDGYGIYDRFQFRVPLGEHGDVFDRYMMRVLEMRESLKILDQALRDISAGPIIDPKAKLRGLRPKAGEAYGRIESPKGELGFFLISDGSQNPYRYRVRPPSLINLTVLEDMCLDRSVADIVVILGSVDIVLGEVDR